MALNALLCVFSALLIACRLRMIAAVEGSGNSSCGVYGWTIPPPPEGVELVQVHAVIRHGDRTPWSGAICWPNDHSEWVCDLNGAEVPIYSNSEYGNVIPRLYRKVFKIGGEVLIGNCSVGQLTTIGYHQQVMNGQALKVAYVDSGFLSKQITTSEVYIRSDDEPRTLKSAESLMWGMFPPLSQDRTEVVDLITMDNDFDDITANPKLCPKVAVYQQEFYKSKLWLNHWNVTKALFKELSTAIRMNLCDESDFIGCLTNLSHIADCLRTHHCHNLSWPSAMTEDLANRTWAEVIWQVFNTYKYPSVAESAQVGIGFLLKELWKQMDAAVEGKDVQRFFLYSGHDTTLIPIQIAFQVDRGMWPHYASMFLMELYKTSGKYAVRVIFNGNVLQLPFCSGSSTKEGLCDYHVFANYMQTITPTNPKQQCSV